ncbi:MAG TPA: ABC transporter permease [Gammaproteobacteria bacterium]|nr:ABC transporter permease [Gammaproteobacteria bacterium]
MKKFLAIFRARNREFLRDRSTVGWNIILPIVLVFGLGFIFSDTHRPMFKVGVVAAGDARDPFLETEYVQFIPVEDADRARQRVARHQLDMLLELGETKRYWINPDSPRGYVLERMLPAQGYVREEIEGREVRYVDWLVPGILGMNLMFSCLFGVGYVLVRYRKSGFLKRLNATPLSAFEFLAAQVGSRLWLTLLITIGVFLGTDIFLDYMMNGSWLLLLFVTTLGAISMISLGLMMSARVASEELAGGLLNLVSWPMMILSGVWFSLEGAPVIVQWLSKLFPLTYMLDAARRIMIDGAGLADVWLEIVVLAAMSAAFLALGAAMFRWKAE